MPGRALAAILLGLTLLAAPIPIDESPAAPLATHELTLVQQRPARPDHTRVDRLDTAANVLETMHAESLRKIGAGALIKSEWLDTVGKILGIIIACGTAFGLAYKVLLWREERFAKKVEAAVRKAFASSVDKVDRLDIDKFNTMCDRANSTYDALGVMEKKFNRHLSSMEDDIADTLSVLREHSQSISEVFFLLSHALGIERRRTDRRTSDVDTTLAGVERRRSERRKSDLHTGDTDEHETPEGPTDDDTQ